MSGGERSAVNDGIGPDGAETLPCEVWAVLNVTPDSFSDGGEYIDPDVAVRGGLQMLADGANVIDVGGESTRPAGRAYGEGAAAVPVEDELRRVIPVVERLGA